MKHIISLTLGAMLLLPSISYAEVGDMVHYWKFDEGYGRSANDAIGGQNGVLTGSSTGFGWASGKVGTALGFDGGAGESVALPDGFVKGSQGTISLWFKLNSLSDNNILFSGRSTSDNNIFAMLGVDREGRPTFTFRDVASGADKIVQGLKILNKNEWYLLVFTANTQGYHMYVNGEDVGVAGENTGRWISDMTNQTFSYRIGAISTNPHTGVLDGMVDDLRIYGRALSGTEASELYDGTNNSTPTVPAAIAPSIAMTISSERIPYGGTAIVRWDTKNVVTCAKSGSWSGSAQLSGEEVFVQLASDATYTLSCGGGKGGNTTASVKVSVSPQATSSQVVSTTITNSSASSQAKVNSNGTLNPAGLSREELIKAIIARINDLLVELKALRGY